MIKTFLLSIDDEIIERLRNKRKKSILKVAKVPIERYDLGDIICIKEGIIDRSRNPKEQLVSSSDWGLVNLVKISEFEEK